MEVTRVYSEHNETQGSSEAQHLPLTVGVLQKYRLFPGCQLEPGPPVASDVYDMTLPGG